MPIWEAVVLGIIQGLTEFLPISSTAHLLVARGLIEGKSPEDGFTTIIQLGTLVAVIGYFRKDILLLLRAVFADLIKFKFGTTPESRMAGLIVLGSIPVGIGGLVAKSFIEKKLHDPLTIGVVAVVFALLMFAAEIYHRSRREDRHLPETPESLINWKHSLWMGLWQMLALIPGASRSGTTITGGLFAGLERAAIARFSFLLSLPAITAAGLKTIYDEYKLYADPEAVRAKHPDRPFHESIFASQDMTIATLVATVVSGIVGYFVIAWLIGYLKKHDVKWFVLYRVIFGIALIALVLTKVIS